MERDTGGEGTSDCWAPPVKLSPVKLSPLETSIPPLTARQCCSGIVSILCFILVAVTLRMASSGRWERVRRWLEAFLASTMPPSPDC